MHRNPYRRRPTSASDQYLEFEEYDEDEDEDGVMSEIVRYELNPPGRGPRQRSFGAGGGHYDDGGWHAGGGRYLDPAYLPADYPDGVYHPGGGQVSRGYHGGGGYYSNPYGGMLDDQGYQSPWDQNPYRYRLPRPPRDPRMVRAFNNPPSGHGHRCHHCGCHL